jgi:hypothetical protein
MTDNSNIVDKEKYQTNRRWMAWTALGTMLAATGAVLIWPARFEPAESVLMMMYGALSALVGAYFGFSRVNKK